jgi:hypothetical protein
MRKPIAALMVVLIPVSLNAAEPKGPLADLPSKPGPHVQKIRALGDGEWLDLGKAKPDAKWGLARGRAYTPKMAEAADLGGAFLHGQGVHGYVKKESNRVMDDAWFYDLNAHRWICIHPGTSLDTLDQDWTADERGFLVDKDGESRPIVGIVHGYNSIAYSPDRKEFITWHGVGYAHKKVRAMWDRLLPAREAKKAYHNRQHPYLYEVATGRWRRDRTSGKGPGSFRIYGATCVWLPTKKVFALYLVGNDLFFYDVPKKAWAHVKPKGAGPGGGYEGVSCFDTKRNRLYVFNNRGAKFGIYDVETNAWLRSKDPYNPGVDTGRSYHTTKSIANYDQANDVVVLFHNGKTQKGAFVYDPRRDKWLNHDPLPGSRRAGRHGFYDANLNVHVFFDAKDSRTNPGNIRLWRYRKEAK